jgi:hypothetical protein
LAKSIIILKWPLEVLSGGLPEIYKHVLSERR